MRSSTTPRVHIEFDEGAVGAEVIGGVSSRIDLSGDVLFELGDDGGIVSFACYEWRRRAG